MPRVLHWKYHHLMCRLLLLRGQKRNTETTQKKILQNVYIYIFSSLYYIQRGCNLISDHVISQIHCDLAVYFISKQFRPGAVTWKDHCPRSVHDVPKNHAVCFPLDLTKKDKQNVNAFKHHD
jgi:hypothetical protein